MEPVSLAFSPQGKPSSVLAVYNVSKGCSVLPSVRVIYLFVIEKCPVKIVHPQLEFKSFLLFRSPCQKLEMALQQVHDSTELNCCTKSAGLQVISEDNWNENRASKVTGAFFHFLLEVKVDTCTQQL